MSITVKCLSAAQKDDVVSVYQAEQHNLKQIAKMFHTSARTINRVLQERGLATPVPRLQIRATKVLALLDKHHLTVEQLAYVLAAVERMPVKAALKTTLKPMALVLPLGSAGQGQSHMHFGQGV